MEEPPVPVIEGSTDDQKPKDKTTEETKGKTEGQAKEATTLSSDSSSLTFDLKISRYCAKSRRHHTWKVYGWKWKDAWQVWPLNLGTWRSWWPASSLGNQLAPAYSSILKSPTMCKHLQPRTHAPIFTSATWGWNTVEITMAVRSRSTSSPAQKETQVAHIQPPGSQPTTHHWGSPRRKLEEHTKSTQRWKGGACMGRTSPIALGLSAGWRRSHRVI